MRKYQYDTAGRRLGMGGTFARSDLPAAVALATYNDANRLTQKDAATYSYDANGNLINDGTKHLYLGRTESVDFPDWTKCKRNFPVRRLRQAN